MDLVGVGQELAPGQQRQRREVLPSPGAGRLQPLLNGVRLVAVTWLQSLVRSAERRRLLFELGETIAALETPGSNATALLRLRAHHDNLLRLWVEA